MKLLRFKVTNFRSVKDSGWIDTNGVTALIGTNESGKTNLLLPLWKLNPAKDGAIKPTADFPRKHYTDFRNLKPKPVFIRAVFALDDDLAGELARLTGAPREELDEVQVSRRLDGTRLVSFPNAKERTCSVEQVRDAAGSAAKEIEAATPLKSEEALVAHITAALKRALNGLPEAECRLADVEAALDALQTVNLDEAPKTSSIVPRFKRLIETVQQFREQLSRPSPSEVSDARKLVLSRVPKFVYYSHYGNLDSEIYLPHVIENLAREEELGQKEGAKARTLKVLFEFVGLQPDEILELGKELAGDEEQILLTAEKKKERSILLQSASTKLTDSFREWWKQGDYRFRFEADGNHFRIWVSDDRRPEEIELEGRSSGLQWFLSFYLVFLVESRDAHANSILLLDEPGHSLHPLAQRDLSEFFDSLAERNQLAYTTHSPFLVDADRLDRARKVYVDADGTSKASSNLRAEGADITRRGAAYAVHAALELTVAESLLLGCQPIVVEGPSDQHYLTGIKTLLISADRLRPSRELVFPPAGGAKGVKVVASILCGRDEELPAVLLDADSTGKAFSESLRKGLYSDCPHRVLDVGSFVNMPNAEIEDLVPPAIVVDAVDRWQRGPEVRFADRYKEGTPIVPQIEAWAATQGVTLESPGWKVELAKMVKRRLLSLGASEMNEETIELWQRLFGRLQDPRAEG